LRSPLLVEAATMPLSQGPPLYFLHLSKRHKWLCEFVAGKKAYTSPLADTSVISTLALIARRRGSAQLAAAELDATPGDYEFNPEDAGSESSGGAHACKRPRVSRLCEDGIKNGDIVFVAVPMAPRSPQKKVVRVWLRKDGVYLIAESSAFAWMRDYARIEIEGTCAREAPVRSLKENKQIWWCKSSNFFKVRVSGDEKIFRVHKRTTEGVAYSPAEFNDEVARVRKDAEDYLDDMRAQ
jgi:hypothetical protein